MIAMASAFLALLFASFSVLAISPEFEFLAAINAEGKDCEAITAASPIGMVDNGDALINVVCSNGSGHVIRIHQDNSIDYLSTCSIFLATTNKACLMGN